MALTPQQEDALDEVLGAVVPDDYASVVAAVRALVEMVGGVNDIMSVHFLEMHTDPDVTHRVEALLDSVPGMPDDGPLE